MKRELVKSDFVPRPKKAIVRQLRDEFLVYDQETNRAHCLNQKAAEIWKLCDGKRNVAEIVEAAKKQSKPNVPEEMVWTALVNLGRAGLLQNDVELSRTTVDVSRRQAMRQVGTAAVLAVPAIASILVPRADAAVSCSPLLGPCNPKPCCGTGVCVNHLCAAL
jgi:Coenzyme PQQ synthesis protein D (PqqD)